MSSTELSPMQAGAGRIWSAVLVVSGVALVVWATVVLSAQAVYWIQTGVWVPINVFHAAFLNAAVTAGQPLVVSLVSIENGLARLVVSMPPIELKQAVIRALGAVPFSAALYSLGAILLYMSKEGMIAERAPRHDAPCAADIQRGRSRWYKPAVAR